MKIAICEDNRIDAQHLRALCREYGSQRKQGVETAIYPSAERLLDSGAAFGADVLLLDIYMGNLNGIEAARRMRDRGFSAPIILVTCSVDHYPAGYEIEAVHYLSKPVESADFFEAMNRAVRRLPPQEKVISLVSGRRQRSVPVSSIVYIEVRNHQTNLVTTLGTMPLTLTLGELEELMDNSDFYRCFRSYVVNLSHIRGLEDCSFVMSNGNRVPITRRNLTAAENRYMEYLFRDEDGAAGRIYKKA